MNKHNIKQDWNNKILARSAKWSWHDEKHINILDNEEVFNVTLDEWQTLVYHESDGNKTIENIILWFPTQYEDKKTIPHNYEKHILQAGKDLIFKLKIIELWDSKEDLNDYFDLPRSK